MYRVRISVVLVALLFSPLTHAEELHFVDESVVRNTTIIDCSSLPGTVPITAETRPAARIAQIPDNVNCWNPKDANVGLAVGEAKVYLRSMLCGSDRDDYGGAGADGTISGLNAKFAVCAAAFIKAASAQMSLCIREGYRTEAKQKEYFERYKNGGGIACDPSKGCEHPRGIAIDINTTKESDYARLWDSAPQFGLSFYLRERDKYHFVPEKSGCVLSGEVTNPNASLPIATYDFPAQAPSVNPFQNANLQFLQPLMQQLAQTMRSAPNMPQTSQPQIASSPSLPNTTPLPTTPITPTPSTPTPTPTTPITTPVTATTTGVVPTTGSTTIPAIATATPATTNSSNAISATPEKSDRPSWIDIILGIAQFDSKPTAIVPETAPLNPALTNTGGVLQPGASPSTNTTRPQTTQTPTQGVYQGSTFTSSDLSASPRNNSAEITERSRILVALAKLRAGLEQFLGIKSDPRAIQNASRWIPQ